MEIHEHDNFVRLLNIWMGMKPDEKEKSPLKLALDTHTNNHRGLEFVGGYHKHFEKLKNSLR